jgi:hypothetical protein
MAPSTGTSSKASKVTSQLTVMQKVITCRQYLRFNFDLMKGFIDIMNHKSVGFAT